MILAQVKEISEGAEPLWRQAAEFGVLAFLLVVFGGAVLGSLAFILWRLGNRLLDMIQENLTSQAAATSRAADAAVATGLAMTRIADATEEAHQKMDAMHTQNSKSQKASRLMLRAIERAVPGDDTEIQTLLAAASKELE